MKRRLAIILLVLLTVLFIYPSAFIYPKDTLPDNNDTRLIAYIIGQVQENITTAKPLFFSRFFAPDSNTLAYSDPFIITSLVTLPFRLFTDSPILILNLAYILNFVLTIVISILLFHYLLKEKWSAILATILFNFSGFHLHYTAHMQIFSFWLPCLAIYFFLRFQEENNKLYLNLFLFTASAQLAESIFSFYLIFFAIFFLFWRRKDQFKKIFFSTLFAIPLWLTILFPYISLNQKYPEATRPIRDAAHFSLGLEGIFTLYHGWTVIVLFFLISIFLPKKTKSRVPVHKEKYRAKRKSPVSLYPKNFSLQTRTAFTLVKERSVFRMDRYSRTGLSINIWRSLFCFGFIMSLGPVIKIFGKTLKVFGLPIPLPYTLFYYLFPGFQGFRTPSRFVILALFAAVIIIGFRLKPIFQKLKSKTKFLFILLVLSLLFLEADLPLKGYPVNINMHPVYTEVAKLPENAVIVELPIKLWNMPEHEIESVRSLYSLKHKHRRFGGFSGFATNSWIDLVHRIDKFGLNEENTERLKSLGITHYIENNKLYEL